MKLPSRLRAIISLILFFTAYEANAYQFTPDNCGFSMSFETAPTVTEQTVAVLSDQPMQRITYDQSDFAIVVECLPLHVIANDDASIKKMLSDKATFEGLSGWIYFDEGKKKYVRGYKAIYGRPFTLHYYAYRGKTSLLMVTVGGISSGFPQREIGVFLHSVKEI